MEITPDQQTKTISVAGLHQAKVGSAAHITNEQLYTHLYYARCLQHQYTVEQTQFGNLVRVVEWTTRQTRFPDVVPTPPLAV